MLLMIRPWIKHAFMGFLGFLAFGLVVLLVATFYGNYVKATYQPIPLLDKPTIIHAIGLQAMTAFVWGAILGAFYVSALILVILMTYEEKSE